MKKDEQKANFLQVGRITECGSCHPEKFEDCKEIKKRIEDYTCDCVCHDSPINPVQSGGWEERFDNWFVAKYGKWRIGRAEAKDFFRAELSLLLNEARESHKGERLSTIRIL